MEHKDYYTYPAVVCFYPNGVVDVTFPDLEVTTQGNSEQQALERERDCLGLVIYGLEEDGEKIPNPSSLADVGMEPGECSILVEVFMPSIRTRAQVLR